MAPKANHVTPICCYKAIYRDLNKVDTLAASQTLRRLRDAGLLAQKGRGSATYYVETELLASEEQGLYSKPPALSSNPEGLSTNPQALSTNPNDSSTKLTGAEESRRKELLNELPGLAARIGAIGQRHPPGNWQGQETGNGNLRDRPRLMSGH